MNRALPEMLHAPGNVAGVKGKEMSVLERQRLVLKWQQEQLLQLHSQQQQQQQDQSCFNELSMLSFLPAQVQSFQGLDMGCGTRLGRDEPVLTRPIKADPGVEDNKYGAVNYAISRTASCPPLVAEAAKSHISDQKLIMSAAAGRESFKKRKAEKSLTSKQGDAEEDIRSKRSKGSEEEEESKITEQNSKQSKHKENNNNNDKKNREASGCTSKDNSKVSEVHKPDYIHVRARRGQATDSHSLAERVRREKISERMKYLQDLVPGCNKITGKAGMLDEIINYVQSLQRQVEFLSMKLATVNPRLDFCIDDLIAKEVFAACSSSMPTMGVSSDMSEPDYLQYNPIQQMDPGCGSQVHVNQIDMGLHRSISVPVPVPDTFIDPSCFNQIPSSLPWESDLQNIYGMEFQQQGRSTSFPLHTFAGTIGASSLKMEM